MAAPPGDTVGETLRGTSKEEDDLLGRHIKKLEHQDMMDTESQPDGSSSEKAQVNPITEECPSVPAKNTQMSYKASLIGCDSMDTDLQPNGLQEWLEEEEKIPPSLAAELDRLKTIQPEVEVSNEEWKDFVRPWKDALVITLLGRRLSQRVMKDKLLPLWGLADLE